MHSELTQIIKDVLISLSHPVSDITLVQDDDISTVRFVVSYNDPSLLIGRNGEALRSLNYIIRKIAENKFPGQEVPNFVLDVNDYYAKKIDAIKIKAKIVADRAVSFKRNIELEPMSAYDRLIVHAYLNKFNGIKTESVGEGPERHVVVKCVETTNY